MQVYNSLIVTHARSKLLCCARVLTIVFTRCFYIPPGPRKSLREEGDTGATSRTAGAYTMETVPERRHLPGESAECAERASVGRLLRVLRY